MSKIRTKTENARVSIDNKGSKKTSICHKFFASDLILLLALLILTVLAAVYFFPIAMEIPHRDSGIYLYLGSEILKGKTIYLEVWENKPPFIFFINALGLLIGKESPWGIWGLEVAFLFSTLLISYKSLRARLNPLSSCLVIMVAFLATFQYMSGNFTEEYSIVFQALIIYIFLKMKEGKNGNLSSLIIGILTGIVFNIKQTYIDVTISIFIFILLDIIIHKKWGNWKNLLFIGLGFLLPNLLIVIYMVANGALDAMWQTAFVFNFAYSDIGMMERIKALKNAIIVNSQYPFFIMLIGLWFISLFYFPIKYFKNIVGFIASKKSRTFMLVSGFVCSGLFTISQLIARNNYLGYIDIALLVFSFLFFLFYFLTALKAIKKWTAGDGNIFQSNMQTVKSANLPDLPMPFLLGVIDLPIAMLLVVASGRNYPHYFVTFFPSFFLLFFGLVLFLKEQIKHPKMRILTSCILISLFILGAIKPVQKVLKGLGGPYSYNPYREVVKYIRDHSNEDDTLMVWSLDSNINYLAGRSSPSRYANVHPAYLASPVKEEAQKTIYKDITSHPPTIILDMRNAEYPFIDGVSQAECLAANPETGNYLKRTINFVCQNYIFIDQIDDIDVYQLNLK